MSDDELRERDDYRLSALITELIGRHGMPMSVGMSAVLRECHLHVPTMQMLTRLAQDFNISALHYDRHQLTGQTTSFTVQSFGWTLTVEHTTTKPLPSPGVVL